MRLLILLTFIASLAGCAHTQNCPPPPAPKIIDTGCLWIKPMTASNADTPKTKREIIEHEIARQKNCGGAAK